MKILVGDSPITEVTNNKNLCTEFLPRAGMNDLLCDIAPKVGFIEDGVDQLTVQAQKNIPGSRVGLLELILKECITNNNVPELLSILFSKVRFSNILLNLPKDGIESTYNEIRDSAIEKINKYLFFSSVKLKLSNGQIIITSLNDNIQLEKTNLSNIDMPYIKQKFKEAEQYIDNGQYDTALTLSRTLLEEVFIYVIEKKNQQVTGKGNIKKLFKQVQDLYDMQHKNGLDNRIHSLISGLETIIETVASMRNLLSDSHGQGSQRLIIKEHHTKLALNSAITVCEFILSVSKNKLSTDDSNSSQT